MKPEDAAQNTSTFAMVSAYKHDMESVLDNLTKRAQDRRLSWERLKGALLVRKSIKTLETLQRQCQTLNSLVAVGALDI
jgi:hypothetical protein